MATIVYPHTFVANTPARASEVNANFDAVTDEVNGNLDATNLANNAVTAAKISDDAVTTAKILDGNVTEAKLAFDPLIYGEAPTMGAGTTSTVSLGASPGDTALAPAGFLTLTCTWSLGAVTDIVFEINESAWQELPYATASAGGFVRKTVQVFSTGANIRARRVVASSATSFTARKHTVTA